jgi:hypothetical protein
MADSLLFPSLMIDLCSARLDITADAFKVMLVQGYAPDPSHRCRSDVTNEVVGKGYAAGGQKVEATLGENEAGVTEIGLTGAVWRQSSLVADGAVFYHARGGSPADDELVAYISYREPVRSANGSFFLDKSAIELGTRA